MPLWARVASYLGECFFWKQRFFLAAVDCKDAVGVRKQEVARGIFQRILNETGIPASDLHRPEGDSQAIQTPCLNTRGLIAWLSLRRHMTDTNRDSALCLKWTRCLTGVQDTAAIVIALPPGIAVAVRNVRLQLRGDGKINIVGLLQHWPDLPADWHTVRAISTTPYLPAMPQE